MGLDPWRMYCVEWKTRNASPARKSREESSPATGRSRNPVQAEGEREGRARRERGEQASQRGREKVYIPVKLHTCLQQPVVHLVSRDGLSPARTHSSGSGWQSGPAPEFPLETKGLWRQRTEAQMTSLATNQDITEYLQNDITSVNTGLAVGEGQSLLMGEKMQDSTPALVACSSRYMELCRKTQRAETSALASWPGLYQPTHSRGVHSNKLRGRKKVLRHTKHVSHQMLNMYFFYWPRALDAEDRLAERQRAVQQWPPKRNLMQRGDTLIPSDP
ncbi:hypothetical protein ANANG_G00313380 [Anguilla anguilla]|uniref:Uncharacterized protein n=1 Tax=Anguilla anguilla TaxID=7936 RepID=A0A9D3RK11_ANGAN|nr:hypothetical protein ANANG_G00313380 [Anguilla anguilla]